MGKEVANFSPSDFFPHMLSDIRCKSATCPPDRTKVRLTDGGSLYLEVTPASKRWYRKYRFAGKEKRLTLASFPECLIKEARFARDDARKILARGDDPARVRQDEKLARQLALGTTFQAVAEKWLEHWKPTQTKRHHRYATRRLEADAFPEIGRRPIAEITAPQLIAMAKKIEARGLAIWHGGPSRPATRSSAMRWRTESSSAIQAAISARVMP